MMITPIKPNNIAPIRYFPTFSPSQGQERRQIIKGAVNSIVAVRVKGKNLNAEKANVVDKNNNKARKSINLVSRQNNFLYSFPD